MPGRTPSPTPGHVLRNRMAAMRSLLRVFYADDEIEAAISAEEKTLSEHRAECRHANVSWIIPAGYVCTDCGENLGLDD